MADSDDEDLSLDSEESQLTEKDIGEPAVDGEAAGRQVIVEVEKIGDKEQQQDHKDVSPSAINSLEPDQQELEEEEDDKAQTTAMDVEDVGDIAMASSGSEDELPRLSDLSKLRPKPTLAGEEDGEDELQLIGRGTTSQEAVYNARQTQTSPPSLDDIDVFDIPSSPLSDARSDVSEGPARRKTLTVPLPTHSQPLVRVSHHSPSPQPNLPHPSPRLQSVELGNDHTSIAGRIFRRRAPIQLHPYLLEQEQYKQSLRARGLRPVAIASSHHTQEAESQDQESQFQQSNEAEESQPNNVPSSSPMQPISQDDLQLVAQPDQAADYDSDELPGLSTLNNPAAITAGRRGAKRRKVLQTYSRGSAKHTYPQMPVARAERTVARTEPMEDDDVYALPPSPTSLKTPDVLPRRRNKFKKFVVPPGMIPKQLPTPDRSSQTPRAEVRIKQLLPQLSSDSESEQEPQA